MHCTKAAPARSLHARLNSCPAWGERPSGWPWGRGSGFGAQLVHRLEGLLEVLNASLDKRGLLGVHVGWVGQEPYLKLHSWTISARPLTTAVSAPASLTLILVPDENSRNMAVP